MEKIRESKRKRFFPVVLWVDDIQRIEDTLSRFDEFSWICGGYKYKRFSDLIEHIGGEGIFQLKAECFNPYVSLDLGRMDASLYVSSDDGGASLAFYEIAEILGKRQRRPVFFYNLNILILVGIPIQVTLWVMENVWSLAALIVFLFWYLYAGFVDMRAHSKILFYKKNEGKGFFMRNMDKIFVGAVCAFLGAVVSSFVTVFLSRYIG